MGVALPLECAAELLAPSMPVSSPPSLAGRRSRRDASTRQCPVLASPRGTGLAWRGSLTSPSTMRATMTLTAVLGLNQNVCRAAG